EAGYALPHLERHLGLQLAMVQLRLVHLDTAARVVRLGPRVGERHGELEADVVAVELARAHPIEGGAPAPRERGGRYHRGHRTLVDVRRDERAASVAQIGRADDGRVALERAILTGQAVHAVAAHQIESRQELVAGDALV